MLVSQTPNAFCAVAVLFIDATLCIFPACFSNVCLLLGLFASKEGFGVCYFPAYKLFLVLVSCFQTVVLLGRLEDESLRHKQEVVRWVGWILLKVLFLLKWPSNFKMFMNQQPTHLPVAPLPPQVIICHVASVIFIAIWHKQCIPMDPDSR